MNPTAPSADHRALVDAIDKRALTLGVGVEGGLGLYLTTPLGVEVTAALSDEACSVFTSLEIFLGAGASAARSLLVRRGGGLRGLRKLRPVTADDEAVSVLARLPCSQSSRSRVRPRCEIEHHYYG